MNYCYPLCVITNLLRFRCRLVIPTATQHAPFALPTRSFSIALIVHAICCYGYNNVVITLIITNVFNYRLYQNLLLFTKMRATLMREFIHQLLKYQNKASLIHHFQEWRLPPFPLNGNILRAYGVSGKELLDRSCFI